jgi:hypothetical protein
VTPSWVVVRAIVATVTENFPELPAVRLSGLGDTEQLDDAGAPVQAKFTLPEKPESAVAVKLNVAVARLPQLPTKRLRPSRIQSNRCRLR